MATHTLTIDNWRPAPLNAFVSKHWTVGHRKKKADREIIGMSAILQKTPVATTPRRVSVAITLTGRQKAYDPDNVFKSLNDALKRCGLIIDDDILHVELGPVTFQRGERLRTVITLEDL